MDVKASFAEAGIFGVTRSEPRASYQIRKITLHMRRECRERFPRHRLQRKPLVSDPGMHHGTMHPGGVKNRRGVPLEVQNGTQQDLSKMIDLVN